MRQLITFCHKKIMPPFVAKINKKPILTYLFLINIINKTYHTLVTNLPYARFSVMYCV